MTKLSPVIGFPLGHSVSPAVYSAAYAEAEIDARCDPWSLPPEALKEGIERLKGEDYLGACVTVPHKEVVLAFIDELRPEVERIGATNSIVNEGGRLVAHNTDVLGFMRSLREGGFEAKGRRALLLGAGGAARAVAVGLLDAGIADLIFTGRSLERVRTTADAVTGGAKAAVRCLDFDDSAFADACRGSDLIVNCTPIGMARTAEVDRSPIAAALIPPGSYAYDLVYNPLETVFLKEAMAAGAHPIAGLDMLIYQAAENFRLWTGRDASVDIMREAGKKALSAKP